METLQENNSDKQRKKQYDWLKEYQWQKGQSGNLAGRPKGKTLKDFTREFLMSMSEEARIEFLQSIDADIVWRMAEGNPHQATDVTSGGKPIPILGYVSSNNSNQQDSPIKEEN